MGLEELFSIGVEMIARNRAELTQKVITKKTTLLLKCEMG
jgi:hypothetical protein